MQHVDGLDDTTIQAILTRTRSVAMVGASSRPERPSYEVMQFLLSQGFEVTPVNPGLVGESIQGRIVVGGLADAGSVEMVDVFRASDKVGPVINEAIRVGASTVWMQLGVVDEAAAARGRAAGLTVVMDRCPAIEWRRLGLGRR